MIIEQNAITDFRHEYFFLSNFYPCNVEFEGVIYPSSEHAYMASKTTNLDERVKVLRCAKPRDARNYGQSVTLRHNWDNVKYHFMKLVVTNKFTRNHDLREKLIATGKRQLVEGGMWHDQYWGICNCSKHQGEGKNALGQILMEIRETL